MIRINFLKSILLNKFDTLPKSNYELLLLHYWEVNDIRIELVEYIKQKVQIENRNQSDFWNNLPQRIHLMSSNDILIIMEMVSKTSHLLDDLATDFLDVYNKSHKNINSIQLIEPIKIPYLFGHITRNIYSIDGTYYVGNQMLCKDSNGYYTCGRMKLYLDRHYIVKDNVNKKVILTTPMLSAIDCYIMIPDFKSTGYQSVYLVPHNENIDVLDKLCKNNNRLLSKMVDRFSKVN